MCLAVLAAACAWPVAARPACELAPPVLRQGPVQAAWRVDGAAPAVGRHFSLTVRLCPADAVLQRVDATMPEHRHGMNYRPTVHALGDGRWRAEGLMFHMPGRWELRLEVQADGQRHRLVESVEVP